MIQAYRLVQFILIFPLLLLHATVSAEPAEDHWSPDLDTPVWLALADVRELIESEKYHDALVLLTKLEKESPENAEVQNLLGYSYRKIGDLERSMPAYERALHLNPIHKGALEYQGELFLALGQLDKAIENLNKLRKICPVSCTELEELKNEIAEWRSNK